MKENNIFNSKRLYYLLKRHIWYNFSIFLIGTGAVAGLLIFILVVSYFNGGILTEDFFTGLTFPFLFLGGYLFTSNVFSELHSPQKGYMYLTLPASNFEKLLTGWFLTSFAFIFVAVAVLCAINAIAFLILVLFRVNAFQMVNMVSPVMLKLYAIYLVTQPIFLLGALYFRRYNFLKTILALLAIGIVLALYAGGFAKLIFPSDFHSYNFDAPNTEEFFVNIFVPVVRILFWYVMGPFFLIVSYFRLKERQV